MSDYVLLFINSSIASGSPEGLLTLYILTLARILPIIAQAPFFGSRVLPAAVKVTFASTLFIIILPTLLDKVTTPLQYNMWLYLLFIKELFIGYALGLLCSVPFTIVQNVGMIIDHQRGGASLMVNDPTVQNQSSPLGTLFNMVLIYLFFYIDGPFYVIEAISRSYELIPPDRVLSETFFSEKSPFWVQQIKLLNDVMVISTQLAAPALIAILMTDVFLGIANRLAPQVQITFLGMPLKSLLALTIIFIGWYAYNKQTVIEVWHWLNILKQNLSYLQFGGPMTPLPPGP